MTQDKITNHRSIKKIFFLLREIIFIIFLFVSLFLFLAIFSYNPSDSSWSQVSNNSVLNLAGRIGAFIANILLYAFGYLAYIIPIVIATFPIFFIYLKREKSFKFLFRLLFYLVGLAIIFVSLCGFLHLFLTIPFSPLPFKSGGLLGLVVVDYFYDLFGSIGSLIFLFTLFLIGFIFASGLSCFFLIKNLLIPSLTWIYKKSVFFGYLLFSQWLFLLKNIRGKISGFKLNLFRKGKSHEIESVSEKFDGNLDIKNFDEVYSYSKLESFIPSLDLLSRPKKSDYIIKETELNSLAIKVEKKLADFGISAKVVNIYPGPIITRFEIELAPGTKVNRITSLDKDLARSLSVSSVRIVEVIPGKPVVGLEIPNKIYQSVCLRELLSDKNYQSSPSPLTIVLGKDIGGKPVVINLDRCPHLLIAGTTGSGKSVSLNSMILSMLFKASPQRLRLILIDPKMLELAVYEDIPHLLIPVVTDVEKVANAFNWSIEEMERRYQLMAAIHVRNLDSFNYKVKKILRQKGLGSFPMDKIIAGKDLYSQLKPLPHIVIIIDELADMMMLVGKRIENMIARIAQKARASGIHMILATQRPSVDVITGLIKANIPARISFQVSSIVDSRTILDRKGAEQLLGYGDMLYLAPGSGLPIRVHSAYVSDNEISRVVKAWKDQISVKYEEEIIERDKTVDNFSIESNFSDPLYEKAVKVVLKSKRASISYIQRVFKIGYNRSARILEEMEKQKIVSTPDLKGLRKVLKE